MKKYVRFIKGRALITTQVKVPGAIGTYPIRSLQKYRLEKFGKAFTRLLGDFHCRDQFLKMLAFPLLAQRPSRCPQPAQKDQAH